MTTHQKGRISDMDWPHRRQNLKLTGRTGASGNITDPEITAKIEMESAGTSELWIEDLDLDGNVEYVFVEGGRVRVKDATGAVIWQSSICNPLVIGFHDLDGTGKEKCIVAVTDLRTVTVFSGRTGEIYWTYTFERKTLILEHHRLRVGPILKGMRGEQMTVWAEGDEYGYLFAFDQGVRNGRLVWKTKGVGMGKQSRYRTNVLVGDLQGTGENSIIVIQHTTIWMIDPETGAMIQQIHGPPLRNYGFAGIYDIDHDGVDELVFVNNAVQLRVSVAKWSGDAFIYLWNDFIGYGDHEMKNPHWPVQDADGDGRLEIMYSLGKVNTDDNWSIRIVDAASGQLKREITDARLLDSGDADGDGRRELLVENPMTSEIMLVRLEKERLTELLRIRNSVISCVEGSRPISCNHTRADRGRTYFHDVDGDGALEFIVDDGQRLLLYGWTNNDTFGVKDEIPLKDDIEPLCLYPGADGKYRLLMKQGQHLRMYCFVEGRFVAQFANRSDVKLGKPIVTDIDNDGKTEILLGDSVYAVSQGGGKDLKLTRKWRLDAELGRVSQAFDEDRSSTIIAAWDFDLDGKKELVFGCADAELVMTDCEGQVVWKKRPGGILKGGAIKECAPGRFLTPDRYDLFVTVAHAYENNNESMIIRADTGEIVWRRTDGHEIGMGPIEGCAAVLPLEDDGLDDVSFLSLDTLVAMDGATGKDLSDRISLGDLLGTQWLGYGQLVYVDADGDGKNEVFVSGNWGLNGGLLKRDGRTWQPIWFDYYGDANQIGTPPRNRHQGIAQADGRVLAAGIRADYSYACVDAATGETLWTHELNDSVVSDTATGDIDGDGRDEFIFGCSDGYLYSFKADGTMLFKLDTGAPAGSPVIADVDGDGKAELIVATLDGSLLVIRNRTSSSD